MKKIFFFVILLAISCQKNAEKPILKETGFSKGNFITPEYEIYNILIEKINAPVSVCFPLPKEANDVCDICHLDMLFYANTDIIFGKYLYEDFSKKTRATKKFEIKQIKASNFIPYDASDSLLKVVTDRFEEIFADVYFSAVALNKEKNKAFVKSRIY